MCERPVRFILVLIQNMTKLLINKTKIGLCMLRCPFFYLCLPKDTAEAPWDTMAPPAGQRNAPTAYRFSFTCYN